MNKILALSLLCSASLAFSSCKKDPVAPSTPPVDTITSDWTGELTPTVENRALLVKTTAAWCGNCPRGTETLIKESANPRVVTISLHKGDALTNPASEALRTIFTASAQPNFHVGNQGAGTNPSAAIQTALAKTIVGNIGHQIRKVSGKIEVNVQVEFPLQATGDYYVGVYAVQKEVESAESKSLLQNDYNNILEDKNATNAAGGSDKLTFWKKAGADGLITAGMPYVHAHVLSGFADGYASTGKLIATNPASGEKFNQMATITPLSSWGPLEVVTILWKKNGSTYEVVNAYKH